MKKAIKLTSAMTGKKLAIEVEDIGVVEDNEGGKNKGQAKVYTKNNGNFYVEEDFKTITEHVFN